MHISAHERPAGTVIISRMYTFLRKTKKKQKKTYGLIWYRQKRKKQSLIFRLGGGLLGGSLGPRLGLLGGLGVPDEGGGPGNSGLIIAKETAKKVSGFPNSRIMLRWSVDAQIGGRAWSWKRRWKRSERPSWKRFPSSS